MIFKGLSGRCFLSNCMSPLCALSFPAHNMYACYAGYDISWEKSFQFFKVNYGLKSRWGKCLILHLSSYGPTCTTKNELPVQQYKPDQKAFLWHFCAWSLLLWDSLVVNCPKKLTSVKISLIINTSNYSPIAKIWTGINYSQGIL